MIDYIYDGSFDGLLTVIWHHYYTDRAAGIFTEDRYQPSFLQGSRNVMTDPQKADRVYRAIRQKISEHDLRSVYRAYLSCDPEKEIKILRYVVLGFKLGHRTFSLHSDPVVADFQAILKKISKEQERMMQFVRFSVMEGDILYARIEPDNDVIELAAPHFCDRFHRERFIIHDVGRDKAVLASSGRWLVSAFALSQAPKASAEERDFRQLWKTYFDHIAILERTNARCQNNFIPDRYRKHLTEITTPASRQEGPEGEII
ncbi:MAG: TIGR03915 family putative DNA repair protein [Firmicutes bacterium]|nr:TIGR03915 family putative DNA repair protein [Bacillota bacterium]